MVPISHAKEYGAVRQHGPKPPILSLDEATVHQNTYRIHTYIHTYINRTAAIRTAVI